MIDLINILSNFCSDDKLKYTFSVLGKIFTIVFIIVPILIILIGTIDFLKIIISKDADMKESSKKFFKRLIFGICVFFIMPIVSFFMNLIGINIDNDCMKCFANPNDKSQCSYSLDESNVNINNDINTLICSGAQNKKLCCKDKFGKNDDIDVWEWDNDVGCINITAKNPYE